MQNLLYIGLIILGIFIGILSGSLLDYRVYNALCKAKEAILKYSYIIFPVITLITVYYLETTFSKNVKIIGSILALFNLTLIKIRIRKKPKTQFMELLQSSPFRRILGRTIKLGIGTAALTLLLILFNAPKELIRITFTITIAEAIVISVYWYLISYYKKLSKHKERN